MTWPIYLRGFPGADPLDRLTARTRWLLHMTTTAAVTAALVYAITDGLHLVAFTGRWLEVLEVVSFTVLVAPVVVAFRRSSSLFSYLFIFLPLFGMDLFLEAHFRAQGRPALWEYLPGTFLAALHPAALRSFLAQSCDGLVVGPLALWISRSVAWLLPGRTQTPVRSPLPFPAGWTEESVERPARGFSFWVLRVLGLVYLGYFALLLLGGLGSAAWPASIADLFRLTYANPYLAMNTAGKVCLMAGLATVGAYHRRLRPASVIALLLGHLNSVLACLFFYFRNAPSSAFHGFLLESAVIDGVMVALFAVILVVERKQAPAGGEQLPTSFSLPQLLWRVALIGGAVYAAAVVVGSWLGRLEVIPVARWSQLFWGSDPALGNSLTLNVTLGVLCVLMALRADLRAAFSDVVSFALGASVLLGLGLLAAGHVTVAVAGRPVLLQPYLVLHLIGFGLAIAALVGLRRLSFNVERAITSFGPASAEAIDALHEALFPEDDRSDVLQAVDRYAGTIRGRKRGLINFPFWLLERVFPPLLGLHPPFSAMSPPERLYFLRRYLIRPEAERARALMPELAELAYPLAVAAQSINFFAAYAGPVQHQVIGYVPPGARDRLQGTTIPAPPPYERPAPLPRDDKDPLNWTAPGTAAQARLVPAPRVSTPLAPPGPPDEVDYLVIGSGPGGAVAAYRLICAEPNAQVAVLERGQRYSPLQDFNERELEMIAKLYKEGGLQQTKRADMIVLQGECVGGGSVINNAVCYRMPQAVRARWQNEFGLELSGLDAAYARVGTELGIGPLPPSGTNHRVAQAFQRAVDGLNRAAGAPVLEPAAPVEVNGPWAEGDGLWNLGNRYFGKRSVLETYIPWAEARGVRFVSGCTAVSLTRKGSRAASVLVHTQGNDLVRVRVRRAVLVAGGVLSSSHFLMRSGIQRPVGRGLSCNFALPGLFSFDETLSAFDGEQISLGAKDPQGRAIFETYFNPPGAFALMVPFYFGRHRDWMKRYGQLVSFGALVGSEAKGVLERRPDPLNGQAFNWALGEQDRQNLLFALQTLFRLGEQAGARAAVLPTRPGIELQYGRDSLTQLSGVLGSRPLRLEDLVINTAHPQGGNRMAAAGSAHEGDRVVDERFRVVGLENVYVVDASVFPTSLTVNPQWTIMAMSTLAAAQVVGAPAVHSDQVTRKTA